MDAFARPIAPDESLGGGSALGSVPLLILALFLAASYSLMSLSPLQASELDSFEASYKNTGNFGGPVCWKPHDILGKEPTDEGQHPVFVHLVGTTEDFDNAQASAAVQEMAERGFVAATVDYPNVGFGGCSAMKNKSECVFDEDSHKSAITVLCERSKADCSKGIVVSGASQGAVLATLARNFHPGVNACYGGGLGVQYSFFDLDRCLADGNRMLPSDRLRAVNGEEDGFMGGEPDEVRDQLEELTGQSCGRDAFSCFRSNNSGWFIVRNNAVKDGEADHCYLRDGGCGLFNEDDLDPNWRNGSDSWSLVPNLEWLAGFADN